MIVAALEIPQGVILAAGFAAGLLAWLWWRAHSVAGAACACAAAARSGGGRAGSLQSAADDLPRDHHYVFGHHVLAEVAFDGPKQFFARAGCSDAAAALRAVWDEVGARLGPDAPRLSSAGLGIEVREIAGRRAVVVTLPTPRRLTEVSHAIFIEAQPDSWRYFVYEKTFDSSAGAAQALLCEWRPDGARRNHGRQGPMDFWTAERLLQEQLAAEAQRRAAGAPAWQPLAAPARPGSEAAPGARAQACRFAYELLPQAVYADGPRWLAGARSGAALLDVQELWRRAGALSARPGAAPLADPDLECSLRRVANRPCLLVTLPAAVAPPEMHCLLVVFVPDPTGSFRAGRIYTLACADPDPDAPPLLGVIEPDFRHTPLGAAAIFDEDDFLAATQRLLTSQPVAFLPLAPAESGEAAMCATAVRGRADGQ